MASEGPARGDEADAVKLLLKAEQVTGTLEGEPCSKADGAKAGALEPEPGCDGWVGLRNASGEMDLWPPLDVLL